MKTLAQTMGLVGLGLILFSCGQAAVDSPDPVIPPKPGAKYQLNLFAAPWCVPCEDELKELKGIWETEPQATRDKLSVKIYVEEGANQGQQPSTEMTDAFKVRMGVEFVAVSDTWKWKTYRTFFKSGWNLPASVVLNDQNEVIKKFIGPPKYTAQELMEYLRGVLGNP